MTESEKITKHINDDLILMIYRKGLIKLLPKIIPYTQKYCGDVVAKRQKKRIDELNKFYYELANDNDTGTDDDDIEDISDCLLSIQAKHEYVQRNMIAKGSWDSKKKGILKPNKKSSNLLNQPKIDYMFKKMGIENARMDNERLRIQEAYEQDQNNRNKNKNNHSIRMRAPPKKRICHTKLNQLSVGNIYCFTISLSLSNFAFFNDDSIIA